MTISPARLAANQRNAQKSTGPRTAEGKAVSRLNAFRHGMAGQGDLTGPAEAIDLDLVAERTGAFVVELAAPGKVGELLARRAAVLSLRMERAAVRALVTVDAAVRAARAGFDAERAANLDALVKSLTEAADPGPALLDLAAIPEGLAYLQTAWTDLRAAVATEDPHAIAQARRWLGGNDPHAPTLQPADLLRAIDAELARIDRVAGSPSHQEAAHLVAVERDEVGLSASFDPGPEAELARRYEASAERGMYRAMREIVGLRRLQHPETLSLGSVGPLQAAVSASASATAAAASRPAPAPAPAPPVEPAPPVAPSAGLGSFGAGVAPGVASFRDAYASLMEPLDLPTDRLRKRPDLRKLARNRR